jgi:hypothetical protein
MSFAIDQSEALNLLARSTHGITEYYAQYYGITVTLHLIGTGR